MSSLLTSQNAPRPGKLGGPMLHVRPAERNPGKHDRDRDETFADQQFINRVRQAFDEHSSTRDRMHLSHRKRFIGVADPVIARRVLAVLGGSRSGLTRKDFQSSVIALVRSGHHAWATTLEVRGACPGGLRHRGPS